MNDANARRLEENKRLAWAPWQALNEGRLEDALDMLDDNGTQDAGFHPLQPSMILDSPPPDPNVPRLIPGALWGLKEEIRLCVEGRLPIPVAGGWHADNFVAEGNQILVEVHNNATLRDGTPYKMVYIWIFRVRDGKVVHRTQYADVKYGVEIFPEIFAGSAPAMELMSFSQRHVADLAARGVAEGGDVDPYQHTQATIGELEGNKRLAWSFFEGLNQGSTDVLDLLDDNGTISMPFHPLRPVMPAGSLGRVKRTLRKVGEGHVPKELLPPWVGVPAWHLNNVIAEGDQVALELYNDGAMLDGSIFTMVNCFVLRFEDGKIVRLAEHGDTKYGAEAFPDLYGGPVTLQRGLSRLGYPAASLAKRFPMVALFQELAKLDI